MTVRKGQAADGRVAYGPGMTRTMLWLFLVADLVGVLWAVRVLVREARKWIAWWRQPTWVVSPTLELPGDFVVVPAGRVPGQRSATATPPLASPVTAGRSGAASLGGVSPINGV